MEASQRQDAEQDIDWQAIEESMAGFDPDLRYLATIDGEPAAAMLLSRRVEADGVNNVGDLATLERLASQGNRTAAEVLEELTAE